MSSTGQPGNSLANGPQAASANSKHDSMSHCDNDSMWQLHYSINSDTINTTVSKFHDCIHDLNVRVLFQDIWFYGTTAFDQSMIPSVRTSIISRRFNVTLFDRWVSKQPSDQGWNQVTRAAPEYECSARMTHWDHSQSQINNLEPWGIIHDHKSQQITQQCPNIVSMSHGL